MQPKASKNSSFVGLNFRTQICILYLLHISHLIFLAWTLSHFILKYLNLYPKHSFYYNILVSIEPFLREVEV